METYEKMTAPAVSDFLKGKSDLDELNETLERVLREVEPNL